MSPGEDLIAVEALAPPVLLHDQVRILVDALVGREAFGRKATPDGGG